MLSSTNFRAAVGLAIVVCSLVQYSDACYNVAMSYKVDESYQGSCPHKTDERLLRVTKLSLKHGAGMLQGLDELEWTAYIQEHNDLVVEENLRDAEEEALNHATTTAEEDQRALQQQRKLNYFCDYWCIAHGLYCFCSTSTSWRRQRRELTTGNLRGLQQEQAGNNDVDLTDPVLVQQMENSTREAAYEYLARWDRHLDCLEHPYNVTVVIQDCSVTIPSSDTPSMAPSDAPSNEPSGLPSTHPSRSPSMAPSWYPSSESPTSDMPSESPSMLPSQEDSPSNEPSVSPTHHVSTTER